MKVWQLIGIAATVVAVWWVVGAWVPSRVGCGRFGAGEFGDSFGAVNALFSGLAFAGLIIAIFLQKQELSLQRQELELTRREMKQATSVHRKAQKAAALQAALAASGAQLDAIEKQIVEAEDAYRDPAALKHQRTIINQQIRRLVDAYQSKGGHT